MFRPRCNACYIRIGTNGGVFGNCGHFVCLSCLEKLENPNLTICPVCKESTTTILVNDDMPKESALMMFTDIGNMLEQLSNIYSFQDNHNKLYMTRIKKSLETKEKEVESITEKYEKEIESLKKSVMNNRVNQTPSFFQSVRRSQANTPTNIRSSSSVSTSQPAYSDSRTPSSSSTLMMNNNPNNSVNNNNNTNHIMSNAQPGRPLAQSSLSFLQMNVKRPSTAFLQGTSGVHSSSTGQTSAIQPFAPLTPSRSSISTTSSSSSSSSSSLAGVLSNVNGTPMHLSREPPAAARSLNVPESPGSASLMKRFRNNANESSFPSNGASHPILESRSHGSVRVNSRDQRMVHTSNSSNNKSLLGNYSVGGDSSGSSIGSGLSHDSNLNQKSSMPVGDEHSTPQTPTRAPALGPASVGRPLGDSTQFLQTPNGSRRSLNVPGSVTRHPQIVGGLVSRPEVTASPYHSNSIRKLSSVPPGTAPVSSMR